MTVVIPLRNGDDGRYLRYALRSLAAQGITRCILVGGKPRWYTGEWIAHPDYTPERKEENIRDKVMAGARLVKGEFIFANDDHFLLSPLCSTWNKGLLSSTLKGRNPNGSYARLLVNTINRYGDVMNVDTHCPMMMHTDGVERTMFEWPKFGYGFKTTYCQENNIASEYCADMKLDKPAYLTGREWFSTSDIFPVKALEKMLPVASLFEK